MALFLLSAVVLDACVHRFAGPEPRDGGVLFRVHAPQAKSVSIAGSFNRWERDRDPLSGPDKEGWWSITIPLVPGRYEYLFLLNGRDWLPDPHAPATADDGFGGRNGVLLVEP